MPARPAPASLRYLASSWDWRSFMQALCRLATLVAASVLTGAAFAQPYAYVPNEKSGTISIIDTATDRVTGEIKAGERPRGLAVSPDGRFLYVSDQPQRALNVIDIAKKAIIAK